MSNLIDNAFKDFYDYQIDLTPYFGQKIPNSFIYYANRLKYSFKARHKIDGKEMECIIFTDFQNIKKIWEYSVKKLVQTSKFIVGIPLHTHQGLIYKGEILVTETYLRPEDKNGFISSLPYRTKGSKKVLIVFHVVYHDPSFF